jgi:hypothetical protein
MTAPDKVQSFVEAAERFVARALGVTLDGSEASLAYVDHYIQSAHKGPIQDDVLELVAPALGAYFGQVAIGRFGGRWVLDSESPRGWRIELEPAELRFWPVGMAAAALRGGEVEGYDDSFVTREELTEPLTEALSAAPPVDAVYYYSLTGRLETLAHVLDILIELERRKREEAN